MLISDMGNTSKPGTRSSCSPAAIHAVSRPMGTFKISAAAALLALLVALDATDAVAQQTPIPQMTIKIYNNSMDSNVYPLISFPGQGVQQQLRKYSVPGHSGRLALAGRILPGSFPARPGSKPALRQRLARHALNWHFARQIATHTGASKAGSAAKRS